ncbi:MAG: 30S ribosome-binding factor [Legionellaceae bacterium]
MPKDYSRTSRIAELIQQEIALMLQTEIEDPHLKQITITRVEVTRDLTLAKIYFSFFNEDDDEKEKTKCLNKAGNFLRYHLANRIELRITPQLRFIFDAELQKTQKLLSLLQSLSPIDKDKTNDES